MYICSFTALGSPFQWQKHVGLGSPLPTFSGYLASPALNLTRLSYVCTCAYRVPVQYFTDCVVQYQLTNNCICNLPKYIFYLKSLRTRYLNQMSFIPIYFHEHRSVVQLSAVTFSNHLIIVTTTTSCLLLGGMFPLQLKAISVLSSPPTK